MDSVSVPIWILNHFHNRNQSLLRAGISFIIVFGLHFGSKSVSLDLPRGLQGYLRIQFVLNIFAGTLRSKASEISLQSLVIQLNYIISMFSSCLLYILM